MEENTKLLKVEQVCEMLDISRVKVYELINRKRLKSFKLDGCRRVTARALNDFINQLEEGSGTQG